MKNYMYGLILGGLLVGGSPTLPADETLATFNAIIVDSCAVKHAPSAVTIYTDRAVVTRSGTVTLRKGKNELRFDGLRDNMDLRSIRAVDPKNPAVEILGVTWERHVSKEINNAKITELETAMKKVQDEVFKLRDYEESLKKRKSLVNSYLEQLEKSMNEESAVGGKVKDWRASNDRLNAESVEIIEKQSENSLKLDKLQEEVNAYKREIRLQYGSGGAQGAMRQISVIVTVNAQKEMTLPFAISYTTRLASWTPQYDARLLPDPASPTAVFVYSGVVIQNSGEDWKNVDLKLSTAQPQVSALPPCTILKSLRAEPTEVERSLAYKSAAAVSESLSDAESDEMFDVTTAGENGFSDVKTKGAAVTFDINGKQNLLSGNQPCQVTIFKKTFKTTVTHESAPEMRSGVYLKAAFVNESPYPILAGPISIYRNAGFIGKSAVKYIPVRGNVEFFAGTLDEISSIYTRAEGYHREVGTFSKVDETYSGGTVVFQNISDHPVKTRVRMQMPVSELADVKVKVVFDPIGNMPPTTRENITVDEKNGFVYWDVELMPNAWKNIHFTYCTTEPIQ